MNSVWWFFRQPIAMNWFATRIQVHFSIQLCWREYADRILV